MGAELTVGNKEHKHGHHEWGEDSIQVSVTNHLVKEVTWKEKQPIVDWQ